ncbi:MAG: sigma 54-interacting transcriptional regulator, partial [Candidatus Aminicenantia bacterium]
FECQLTWISNKKYFFKELTENPEKILNQIEELFVENGYSSLFIIFDDIDIAEHAVIELLKLIGSAIKKGLPVKLIYTSKRYYPFLSDIKSYHVNLSFSSFKELRENIWIGHDELEGLVKIAWEKSGGNLHHFHWLIKNAKFSDGKIGYKDDKHPESNLLGNFSHEELNFLELLSCFPRGFKISWSRKFYKEGEGTIQKLLDEGNVEKKGSKIFLKGPWLSIIRERMQEDRKKRIHEIATEIDRENAHFHYFMAGKYEEGLNNLINLISNLISKGEIKEATENVKIFSEYVEKVEAPEKKSNFYSLIAELYLKMGDFNNAFAYFIKSSHHLKPSSREWMMLKARIVECLHGLMKYEKAIKMTTESLKFAKVYNFPDLFDIFQYYKSKNLWKIGKTQESEEILKDLMKNDDPFISGISKRDLGYYSFLKSNYSESKELLKSAINLLGRFPKDQGVAYKYLACVFMKEKNYEESFQFFSRALRIFEKEYDFFNIAGLCSDIGKMFLEKEDFLNAENWFRKANDIYKSIENPRGVSLTQYNLTELMIPYGEWKEAKDILKECAKLDLNSLNYLSYAYDINSLGYIEFLLGNFNEAKTLLKKAEEIFDELHSKEELLDTKIKCAEIFLEEKDLGSVKKILNEIEEIIDSEKEILSCKLLFAKYFLERGLEERAEKMVSEAIEEAVKNGLRNSLANAYFLKAKITKNERNSFDSFTKCIEIFKEINNYFMENVAIVEFHKYFPEKADFQKAKKAIEWLKERSYFKTAHYERELLLRQEESIPKRLLRFIYESLNLEWVEVITLDSGSLTVSEAYPTAEFKNHENIDISFLAPKITKENKLEILQIPLLKSGVLRGFLLCGKKEEFSKDEIEFVLYFLEPLNSMFFKEARKEEDREFEEPMIVGSSLSKIMQIIKKIKDFNYPVLIIGESGTGKELIARYIHNLSSRKDKPFIPLNCSALPENLLESELFGWVKGAFTGANYDRKGLIEEADGGTFFLDEIGDLPLSLQAKLLRVLQEKETRRLGENKIRKIDVRFISATNKDLEEEIKGKRFREDLYYRIKGVVIHIPPLRERKEDIPLLVNHFLDKYCKEMGREKVHISFEAMEALLSYLWHGNVRELEAEIRNTLMMLEPDKKIIELEDLPPHLSSMKLVRLNITGSHNLATARDLFEKSYIEEILKRYDWNRKKTAEALKITRQGLFKLMKKYGIKESD